MVLRKSIDEQGDPIVIDERADGVAYYKDGRLHRAFQPAASNRHYKMWYWEGNLHREGDKPAVIGTDGLKGWWKHGKKHRDGGKPAVEKPDGTKEYWENGKRIDRENMSDYELIEEITSRFPNCELEDVYEKPMKYSEINRRLIGMSDEDIGKIADVLKTLFDEDGELKTS